MAVWSETIKAMQRDGYEQVMVYTQFTDTMDFLREELKRRWRILCYSGRHGEEPGPGGIWVPLTREQTKTKFRDGSVDILLCTDAAAEGLNFQFCGAMINYDMPWNPMRVEQRIGRIDRIGQQFPANPDRQHVLQRTRLRPTYTGSCGSASIFSRKQSVPSSA